MKTVVLSQCTKPEEVALVEELKRNDKQKGKVYRMTVHHPSFTVPETFLTTSKDLFLELGRLSNEAQWQLTQLIHRELADGKHPFILILASEKEGEGNGGVLASVSSGGGSKHIHLARAN